MGWNVCLVICVYASNPPCTRMVYRYPSTLDLFLIYSFQFVIPLGFIFLIYSLHFSHRNSILLSNKSLPIKIPKRVFQAPSQQNKTMNFVPLSDGECPFRGILLTVRLPEFKFWHSATRASTIAFVCTWFSFFDVPYSLSSIVN